MKCLAFFLFFLAALSLKHSNTFYKAQFGAYVNTYGKTYSEQEYRYRLGVFADNMDMIATENAKGHSYKLGLTSFTDLTHEEFKASRSCGCISTPRNLRQQTPVKAFENSDIPEAMDWREKGALTPVKNQGDCGSCWAFAAIASLEAINYIRYGKLYDLSEQQLVDCDLFSHGCTGGLMDIAFDYLTTVKGICSSESYPYLAKEGTCNDENCDIQGHIISYGALPRYNGTALRMGVAEQPITAVIEADKDVFHHYVSGIIDGEECGERYNHGVVVVGYGNEDGKDYFLIRNSWGPDWGEGGYAKIAFVAFGPGVCGLNTYNTYPTL